MTLYDNRVNIVLFFPFLRSIYFLRRNSLRANRVFRSVDLTFRLAVGSNLSLLSNYVFRKIKNRYSLYVALSTGYPTGRDGRRSLPIGYWFRGCPFFFNYVLLFFKFLPRCPYLHQFPPFWSDR